MSKRNARDPRPQGKFLGYPRNVDWVSKRSPNESYDFIKAVSNLLAKPELTLACTLNKLLQEGKIRELVDFKIDYTTGNQVRDYLCARQIQALFSKQDWFDIGYDRDEQARLSFAKAEERCKATNIRLDSERPKGLVSVVSYYATRKISDILGTVPKLEDLTFLYGPGAATNVRSAEASAIAKLSASLMCSADMMPFVGEFLAELPLLTIHNATDIIRHSEEGDYLVPVCVSESDGKLVYVDKSAKTKRPIVVEPILNGLAQKGVGTFIKGRLLKIARLDLRTQERNRASARLGSIDGSLATVDLASASDTLSLGTVSELLPNPWFDFLSQFRTGTVTDQGSLIELEKFSSMGNGFTFELESLIFYSLAIGCCRALNLNCGLVSVFGDDIIIPTEAYDLLRDSLEFYGFEVNTEKSYSNGPFRESCGADYFIGSDIRPFYLRDQISEQTLYLFHNWAMRNCEHELAGLILGWTLEPLRLFGPDGCGDGHLIGSYRLRSNRKSKRLSYEGGFFDTYMLRPRRLKKRRDGDWLYPTYSIYARGPVSKLEHLSGMEDPSDPDAVRGSLGYIKISVYTLARGVFTP